MNHELFYTGIRIDDDKLDGTLADGEKLYIKKY